MSPWYLSGLHRLDRERLRACVLDVLSLMTLSELHQRRTGDAVAFLAPMREATGALVATWRQTPTRATAETDVPAWMRAYLEES